MKVFRDTIKYGIPIKFVDCKTLCDTVDKLSQALGPYESQIEDNKLTLIFTRPITTEEIALDNGLLYATEGGEMLDPLYTPLLTNYAWVKSKGLGDLYYTGKLEE